MQLESYHTFKTLGAELLAPDLFIEKAQNIKALVFDWDGVFHSGKKYKGNQSTFSEIDSMGINMLRFGYYLKHNKPIKTFIITGEKNKSAFSFAKREHIDAVFYQIKNKIEIAPYLQNAYGIYTKDILFLFDDILDFSLAKVCQLRLMMNHSATPLLKNLAKKGGYTDYITAHEGGNYSIRECSELVLDALGVFEETINKRIDFSEEYKTYISDKNERVTDILTLDINGHIIS